MSSVSDASYIIDITNCHLPFAVALSIYERLGNLWEALKICAALNAFPLAFCLAFSPASL